MSDKGIISAPALDYLPHPGGLGCAFFDKMSENRSKLAQIDGLTGEEQTYEIVLQKSIRAALTMRSKGVTSGDITTICCTNNLDICVAYIATLFLGAIPSTFDPILSLTEMMHLLKQVRPKLIFVGPDVVENIQKAVDELSLDTKLVVFGQTLKYNCFSDFLIAKPEENAFKPVIAKSLKDTVAILFSSGTSGLPKGICLNHQGLALQGHMLGHFISMERALSFASFHWISSIFTLVSTILHDGCRIVVPKFIPNQIWNIFNVYKPTIIFLAPTLVVELSKISRPNHIKSLSLKTILISGGPLSKKHVKIVQEIVSEANVIYAYGQTEISGLSHFCKPSLLEEMTWAKQKPTSAGTICPGYSTKIVDCDNEEVLGVNQRGELRVKSGCVMNGYYNVDSSDAWDVDGWIKTGDIAYYDEDGCLYMVDRIKEMLKYRSFHVAPAVLEAVVLQHPAVEAAVVIGIPHEEDGDHPMALVVLSKRAAPEEIQKFVDERLGDLQKLRAGVKIIDRIPVTATGKIKRKDLKEMVLRGEI